MRPLPLRVLGHGKNLALQGVQQPAGATRRAGRGRGAGRKRSPLESALAGQISLAGLPAPVPEFRFDAERRWRFDFAWPDRKVAVECEGGIYRGGRHTSVKGFEDDCEKYAAAAIQGWCVIRAAARQIASGQALGWLEQALKA